MKTFQLLQYSLAALDREDEATLAYLYGHQSERLIRLNLYNTRERPLFLWIASFFLFCFRNASFRVAATKRYRYLFFAETTNQLHALAPVIKSMGPHADDFGLCLTRPIFPEGRSVVPQSFMVVFSPRDLLVALILFCRRAPGLYRRLRREGKDIVIRRYFETFCKSYIYLPFFLRQLEEAMPDFVVESNDHNLVTRALRLAAEIRGIKTVYLQHASVSGWFPAMAFDYALLDGESALDTYSGCLGNPGGAKPGNPVTVFLSGQKKSLHHPGQDLPDGILRVGIGVNLLDEPGKVIALVQGLVAQGVACHVRHHPAQTADFVSQLRVLAAQNPLVTLSTPAEEKLGLFFRKISLLVAGDTSLHLEAALAGRVTFYTNRLHACAGATEDVYGFVSRSLCRTLPDDFLLLGQERIAALVHEIAADRKRQEAIRYYSETFGTSWEGREGELSANILRGLNRNNEFIVKVFCKEKTGPFAVYRIGEVAQ